MAYNTTVIEVINNIRSQLSGNRQQDRKKILSNMDKYRKDENAQEIMRELTRMLVDYLSIEEIETFERVLQGNVPTQETKKETKNIKKEPKKEPKKNTKKDTKTETKKETKKTIPKKPTQNDNIEKKLYENVMQDFNNQRYDNAFNKLDNYIKNNTKRFVDNPKYEYHVLNNDMEKALFDKYVKTKKEVRLIPADVPINDLYYLYAFLLVERNEFKEAEKYLKIALNYNPVSCSILFELVDIYKRMCDWKTMNKYLKLAFTYAYTPDTLARAYRDLGYYHTETGKLDIAVALYIHSLKFYNHDAAHQELAYLEYNGQNIEITMQEVQNRLQRNKIPLVANSVIVKEYRERGDKYTENEELQLAFEMYALAYALDDSLENQMRYKIAETALNGGGSVNITI